MRLRLLIVIVIAYTLVLSGCAAKTAEHEKTADSFLRALAAVDYETARSLSTGKVAYNLSVKEKQYDDKMQPSQVNKINLKTTATSPEWREVLASVSVELAGGDTDITWYRLGLTGQDGCWKVYQAELTGPDMVGEGKPVSGDVKAVSETFNRYLKALANRENSVKYLAGPARRSQEISASVMGDVPVLNNVGEATLTPLWQKDDLMVCQARYVVDGRDAKVVVKFAKCSDTWKIAEVAER